MSKEDISNRSLALLVGVAIVVSLVGILSVKQPEIIYPLTGYLTVNSTTISAEVTRNVAIAVTGTIAFGAGYFNKTGAGDVIVLNSTGDCNPLNTTFAGASCTAQDDADNRILIVNDGNVNVTVIMDLNATSATALNFGGLGDFGYLPGQHESASVGGVTRPACLNETGIKLGDTVYQSQIANATGPTSGRAFSIFGGPNRAGTSGNTQTTICSKLQPEDAYDAINVTIYLNLSRNTPAGVKLFILNFTAYDRFTSEG